jgi:uncharacterized protein (DUF305 family)
MSGMTSPQIRGFLVALLASVAAFGCRTAAPGTMQTASSPQVTASASGVAKARADSARYPYTAADVQFMSHMISHHAQAIVMANWAPTHDASPQVRTLAERIIAAQKDEIGTMQRWLAERRQPVPEPDPAGMKMTMNGADHVMLMPGMLTEEQMKQLDQARGKEFDELFLTFMIQHHRGATAMVRDLFGTYGAAQDETVFKFANDVNVDQNTEIARMQKMLASLKLGISLP